MKPVPSEGNMATILLNAESSEDLSSVPSSGVPSIYSSARTELD